MWKASESTLIVLGGLEMWIFHKSTSRIQSGLEQTRSRPTKVSENATDVIPLTNVNKERLVVTPKTCQRPLFLNLNATSRSSGALKMSSISSLRRSIEAP